MKQRMDRSGLPFKEVLKEFKKRKEDPVVTTLLTFFLDKKVLDLMSSEKGKKVFYKTLEMPEVKTLFKENNKNIVQAQCSEALYSLTISGGKLTKEFRNIVDLSIERLLIENA
jgi:hypothetical protein